MRGVSYTGMTRTAPPFVQDWLSREHVLITGIKLNPALFVRPDQVIVTADGASTLAAVVLNVAALSGPVPAGTHLYFGTTKSATTTADAITGATTIAVSALPVATVGGETATYTGTAKRFVPRGTFVGRTYAERNNATPVGFGPADSGDDEFFLTIFDCSDIDELPEVEVLRHHSVIWENRLPGFDALGSGLKAKIRALYTCTLASA